MIDFSPVDSGEMKFSALAGQLSSDDLRDVTNESIDTLLAMIDGCTDGDIVFEPRDPDADDPHAVEGEEHIGWTVGHLIAHVTASSEEGAAFSSLLARGFPATERPRYETPWREMNNCEKCVQRLEESRRIRLAYLDTWPDAPHLDVHREVSERFVAKFGNLNATAAFLFGLMHEVGHYEQIRETVRQAHAARATA